jgi:hypothetical protein
MIETILVDPLLTLIILSLAVFRVSIFVAEESGPWNFMGFIRHKLGAKYTETGEEYPGNGFVEGLMCVYCNSFWFGIVALVGYFINPRFIIVVSLPFVLSAVTVIGSRFIR